MSQIPAAMEEHLASGITTLSRAWAITRADGISFGFTDHDLPLSFEGITFKPETGMSASALSQSTGLSVDNSEAIGALSDAAITEEDIDAGRYDGAEVLSWLVNWQDVSQRWLQFRGSIGEMRRSGGAFVAELRGLTDALNQPIGCSYTKPCSAILGDAACRFDLSAPGFVCDATVEQVTNARILRLAWPFEQEDGWFTRGRLDVLTGAGIGLWCPIKRDSVINNKRIVELWEPLRASIGPGDSVRLTAGCDKRFATCKEKFSNARNFQGFPDLPGEDWMMAVPKSSGANTGGSRR